MFFVLFIDKSLCKCTFESLLKSLLKKIYEQIFLSFHFLCLFFFLPDRLSLNRYGLGLGEKSCETAPWQPSVILASFSISVSATVERQTLWQEWHRSDKNGPQTTFHSFARRPTGQVDKITLPAFVLCLVPTSPSFSRRCLLSATASFFFPFKSVCTKIALSNINSPNCRKWHFHSRKCAEV